MDHAFKRKQKGEGEVLSGKALHENDSNVADVPPSKHGKVGESGSSLPDISGGGQNVQDPLSRGVPVEGGVGVGGGLHHRSRAVELEQEATCNMMLQQLNIVYSAIAVVNLLLCLYSPGPLVFKLSRMFCGSYFVINGIMRLAFKSHLQDLFVGMSRRLPLQNMVSVATCLLQIIFGAGLLIPPLHRWSERSCWGLMFLLSLYLPAYIDLLTSKERRQQQRTSIGIVLLRLSFVCLMIVWTYQNTHAFFTQEWIKSAAHDLSSANFNPAAMNPPKT